MIGQVVLPIAVGLPIGLQLGATGTGGALLAVPALVYLAGVPAKEAAAMSLVIVAASAWFGMWDYSRLGLVRPKAAVAFSGTGSIGSWLGADGHQLVQGEVLLIGFGIMLLLARYLTHRHSRTAQAESDMSCAARFSRACWLKLAALGLAVGLLNGFFGVGGGFLIVPALTLFAGFAAREAVGTSLCVIAIISLGGLARHLETGVLHGPLLPLVLLGSAAGMLLGARLGQIVSPPTMGRVTASITVVTAVTLIAVNTAKILRLSQ
ncbi:MAG: sulfite exporter TauE/SafE family protein [Nitrospira sp.]|nr:sulfite exporter TauE/SafE family protein [Nitrospira sp.]